MVTEETDEEKLFKTPETKKGKTRERKREVREKSKVDPRRKVHRSRMKNTLQDSAKKRSVEVVLSESLEEKSESQRPWPVNMECSSESEDEKDQKIFFSSKKVNPPEVVARTEDIIDLTGEEDGEDLCLSDLMKF